MKVQELIHQLSAEHVDPNAEVAIYLFDTRMGESDIATVTTVTTTAPWGVQRVQLETEVHPEAYWRALWRMPDETSGTAANTGVTLGR